ncbi:MAG: recombinase family protein [Candidatus Shapirobacteria bacterium]|nr:recombinase family protein [Candidatus Shapirobacteria bacterium]
MKNKKYYIYYGISSTEKYNETETIFLQQKLLDEYVWENNLNVIREYEDSDESGENRTEWDAMMRSIESKKANCIIVYDESILSTDFQSANYLISLLDIGVIKEIRSITTTYGNDPASKLLLTIKLGLINFDRYDGNQINRKRIVLNNFINKK